VPDGRITRLVVDGRLMDGNLVSPPTEPGATIVVETPIGSPVEAMP
jgi:hypothetical protein